MLFTEKWSQERQWEANLKTALGRGNYLALPVQRGPSDLTRETCTVLIDRVQDLNALRDRAV